MYESEFEKNLYQQRRDKLQQIAALGQLEGLSLAEATYPNHYAASHTIPEIRAAYDSLTAEQFDVDPILVSIAGRIMAIRVQGKAGFAQLQQGGQRFQIYVRKDDVGENIFALYKLLDLGDHIGVRGHLFRTRTGELTVHVGSFDNLPALTFLTKAMLALPDKYHGLEDTELRYRQRYVDLFMNTGATKHATPEESRNDGAQSEPPEPETPNVREVFVKRAAILRAIRKFFDRRGYLEVETPMMHQIAGGAAAQPFTTHHNALDLDLFLRIAPELYLKRLVVGGLDRIYEINRNFRNEGISTRHNPEFTMLEFYQAYANYHDLMTLSEELIICVAKEVNDTTITHFNGHEIDLGKWTRLSMREAIIKWWPPNAPIQPAVEDFSSEEKFKALIHEGEKFADPEKSSFDRALNRLGADCHFVREFVLDKGAPYGKAISDLFELRAEALRGGEMGIEEPLIQPTIIYDFPLAVSPLSKIKPDEPDWVERFEFYIGGFEVGNAFSELNDPDDQRTRFEQQMAEKARGDDEAHQMDEDYVRALGYGLPPTAGEGIGIDRLTMLLTNSKSIRDVILFPLLRPQVKQADAVEVKHGESAE
ncbi:lysine--tRNA ligase [Tunturibacter empetritectus]|uniref:Lysine--tRNA ligase n=1 Tax=Tunturiibacter lichenicola TaxID=2051959 RepID=A0A7W8N5M3_9BACT|nr:lysine--tRNA ligase [Edaphobacter lichenicola]MBB5344180.1 lysyl-tRNA synthetase class 2 [Edaphobacter lichenicola]